MSSTTMGCMLLYVLACSTVLQATAMHFYLLTGLPLRVSPSHDFRRPGSDDWHGCGGGKGP